MAVIVKDQAQIIKESLDYTLFSWSKQGGLNPMSIERAKGVYLYAHDGKRYIDFSSQLMNMNIGHGHPRVAQAVARQMESLSFVHPGMVSEVRGKVGKKLAEISPEGLQKTFFTLGGAEAVENAIKLARIYTGRHKIVTLYQSYHGATYATMSAGGDPRKFAIDGQQAPNFVHVENPYFYRCPWGTKTPEECGQMAFAHLERVVKMENPASIAAIMLEGESGSSGCIKYPAGYWKAVRQLCDQHGILLIDDEVMSGFGRTGKMFAIEHHGVAPDLLCMAKGLTCGYVPLGGVLVSEKIAAAFDEKMLPLGLTYSAHPVSLAAALEVLQIYEDENLVENAANMGRYIDGKVAQLREKHPSIGDWRNTGLLGCLELVKNRETKEPITPWNAAPNQMEATNRMAAKMRELGMFTFIRWNWLFIAPPLCITEAEADEGLDIIDQILNIADEYCV
ncbi:MAG: aminotransferase class III-fold pyridoxal phosphate-dependent enzyme [Bacteroidetes bacterium]|nr:aminotransferase class III-fold pyridoxal phosphate-dependent enzyme [Bacteroidota bacterium]